MKRELNSLTLSYLLFLLMLSISSIFEGALNTIVYILSFLLPLCVGIYLSARYDGEKLSFRYFRLKGEDIAPVAALVFPTTLITFSISLLTSLLFYLIMGASNNFNVGGNVAIALLLHAAIPAVFEELLFRYLPMRALGKRSPRVAVLASGVFFAFVHHSFFSIPYAFVAGIIFMVIDLATGSVIPSIIIHFINNVLSVIWIMYSDAHLFAPIFFGGLVLLSLISSAYIFIRREKYLEMVKRATQKGEKYIPSYEPLLFIIPTVIIAISELIV